jgi:hypothetical protein
MDEKESKALSINAERSDISLESEAPDKAATTLKGLLGIIPGVGSVLQEAVGVVIPNQRIDRVVRTMKIFAQKVDYIESDVLRLKMLSEEFTDFLEDAIPQAARSLSDERREYIASFLKNGLTNEELTHVQQKKLLSILGELNDAEIIFLRYESLRPDEQREFFEQHNVVLAPIAAPIGAPVHEHDQRALRISFQEKLFALGLLQKQFVKVQSGKPPDLDEKTGMLKVQRKSVTQLGRALLRYIDQPASSDRDYQKLLDQKRMASESEKERSV